jgi:Uma2 family endonuclease
MASTVPTSQPLKPATDTWVAAGWEDLLALANNPEYEKARFYYDQGCIRIETMPIGPSHARDNSVVSNAINFFATLKNIRIVEFTGGSFRKSGVQESQPDLSFYIGSAFQIPPRSNTPIDVGVFDPPTLVIEIASTTLSDDLGRKRLLYERLGVQEYWVVDVNAVEIIAFAVANGGSKSVRSSSVLPGLPIELIEEALRRSQTEDDGALNRWLLQIFSEL